MTSSGIPDETALDRVVRVEQGATLQKMQRVAQALQFAIVVQLRRPFSGKGQLLQKRELFRRHVGAQRPDP